jgi:O-acetyl-ADP-ribose deacetylase (regulator of RNase III)
VGVAAALRRIGGEELASEARSKAPVGMGDVVWTGPGRLRARHVAHAVAALGGAICLGRATLRTLLAAESRQLRRVAFPALGTGVGRVPPALAAKLMLEAIVTFARLKPRSVEMIDLFLYDEGTRQIFRDVLHAM